MKKKLTKGRSALLRFLKLFVVSAVFVSMTGCVCSTRAWFGAARIEKQAAGDILVCPAEPVHLWWRTEHAQETAIDQGIGPVTPAQQGFKTISAPASSTTYKLTAVGRSDNECSVESPTSVQVVTPGYEYTLVLNTAQKGSYVWIAELSELLVSPSIIVTSVRLHQDTAASWGNWHLQKTNPDGSPVGIQLTSMPTSVPSNTPLLGRYQLSPIGSCTNCADSGMPAAIILKLKCIRQ